MSKSGFNQQTSLALRKFLGTGHGKTFLEELYDRMPRAKTDTVEEAALTGSKSRGYLLCIEDISILSDTDNYTQKGRKNK